MTSVEISFFAEGAPVPQGNKSLGRNRATGKAVILEGRDARQRARFHGWRNTVVTRASLAMGQARRRSPIVGPVSVELLFVHTRPKSTPAGQRWRTKMPDVDKLARAVLDALTIAGLIGDDAQVAELTARKVLAHSDETPGVNVTVRTLDHTEAP